jgi:hypothetical protein
VYSIPFSFRYLLYYFSFEKYLLMGKSSEDAVLGRFSTACGCVASASATQIKEKDCETNIFSSVYKIGEDVSHSTFDASII